MTSTLPAFVDLGTARRGQPCKEYPGVWILVSPNAGHDLALESTGQAAMRDDRFDSFNDAFIAASNMMRELEASKTEYDPRLFSICWSASDNDPRIGQVWFTPFYQLGRFTMFGTWKES